MTVFFQSVIDFFEGIGGLISSLFSKALEVVEFVETAWESVQPLMRLVGGFLSSLGSMYIIYVGASIIVLIAIWEVIN